MATPTEAEAREAIQVRLAKYSNEDPRQRLIECLEDMAGILTGPAFDLLESPDGRELEEVYRRRAPESIWDDDLRPSEAMVLRRHGEDLVQNLLRTLWPIIVDETVAAVVAAGAEIPDAPRAIARD
jgi:hypothetical protein